MHCQVLAYPRDIETSNMVSILSSAGGNLMDGSIDFSVDEESG